MGLSASGESVVLTALLTGRYISLHTADPGISGGGEVTGGAYARQPVTFAQSGSNPTVASNNAVVQYPTATANWGTVNFYGIWSAASGGTFYGGYPVTLPKAVGVDDIVRWDVNKLQIATDEII